MEVELLTATLGARVNGVDLRDIARVQKYLRPLLTEHGLLTFSGQSLSADELHVLAGAFGDTTPHPMSTTFRLAKQKPDGVTHDASHRPEDTGFHSDYTFYELVAETGILQAQVLPKRGGDTHWTDMQAAFETLSPALQSFLGSLTALHAFSDKQMRSLRERFGDDYIDQQPEMFRGAVHPVIIRHPKTGRPLLFVSPGYTRRIMELHTSESEALLKMLAAHINQPRFHCRYRWAVDDIGVWDELRTAHEGPIDYWPERRVLRRETRSLLKTSANAAEKFHDLRRTGAKVLLLTTLRVLPIEKWKPVWTSTWTQALGACGIEEDNARQQLARVASQGILVSEKRGPRASWRVTKKGQDALMRGRMRMRDFGVVGDTWDGRWLVVICSVPERERAKRRLLRGRLAFAGFGFIEPSVAVSTHVGRESIANDLLDELGLSASATVLHAKMGKLQDERAVLERAWDLAELTKAYERFIRYFEKKSAKTPAQCFAALVQLELQWFEFLFLDPELPRRLLPAPWAGDRAKAVFDARRTEWIETAARWFNELNAERS